ncbi:hypothetical protein E1B28_003804 [Marasmius oreades]|uniref:Zn(2)-C6 fungal-type domain-containing protein n=1 Tax=Marasmius oreades TaxID=181124 RepID=A0A9P8AC51_9AGAR|nr:uncharacterized protein E1B28_003804 [Marasmius oreades]KAG7096360.1 hypothetical protein E1B28_003804 [Marasmius oreades]
MSKGSACTNCRKRKIRCDGARPQCRACRTSSEQFQDCEYTDLGVTHSQRLEEQIAILEAKVHELEAHPHLPSSPSPARQPESCPINRSLSAAEAPLSSELHQTLIHRFIQSSADLAFFLNTERFLHSFTTSARPSQALLNTIYLWGIHLSHEPQVRQHEPQFLAKALQSISHCLAGATSLRVLHTIQASVLIAQYFFRNSRILEGKYHMTAAHSLSIGARLHTIRSSASPPPPPTITSPTRGFPPPVDPIEEGEHIRAFWTVIILNTCWQSLDGESLSNMVYTKEPGLRIDTPWPEDMDTYVTHGIPYDLVGDHTVEGFLRGMNPNSNPPGGQSWISLHAKASILFERATQIGAAHAHWKTKCIPTVTHPLDQDPDFLTIDIAIQTLSHVLSSVKSPPTKQHHHILVPLLINAASIRLHQTFIQCESKSTDQNQHVQSQRHHHHRVRVVDSARNIVRLIAHYAQSRCIGGGGGAIDPIVAPLSMIAFHTLQVAGPGSASGGEYNTELETLIDAMGRLSSVCPVMTRNVQAAQVRAGG